MAEETTSTRPSGAPPPVFDEQEELISGGAASVEEYCRKCDELMGSWQLTPVKSPSSSSSSSASSSSTSIPIRVYQTEAILPNPTKTIVCVQEFPMEYRERIEQALEDGDPRKSFVLYTLRKTSGRQPEQRQIVRAGRTVHWKIRHNNYIVYPSFVDPTGKWVTSTSTRWNLFPTCDRLSVKDENTIVLETILTTTTLHNKTNKGVFPALTDYMDRRKAISKAKRRAMYLQEQILASTPSTASPQTFTAAPAASVTTNQEQPVMEEVVPKEVQRDVVVLVNEPTTKAEPPVQIVHEKSAAPVVVPAPVKTTTAPQEEAPVMAPIVPDPVEEDMHSIEVVPRDAANEMMVGEEEKKEHVEPMYVEIKSLLFAVDPNQVCHIDTLMLQFRGREDELLDCLQQMKNEMATAPPPTTAPVDVM